MHSTVAANVQTPSQRARNQSTRSARSRVAVRKANSEFVDVLGGKSMILVCIFSPLKSSVSLAVHGVARKSCRKRGARSYFGRARLPNGRYAQPALGNDSMSQTTLDREMRRAAGPRRSTSDKLWFGGVSSLSTLACVDPRLGTLFGPKSRLEPIHFSALVVPIGHSGASPYQV